MLAWLTAHTPTFVRLAQAGLHAERTEALWRRVVAFGLLMRVALIVYVSPLDRRFSDAQRHWENAQQFFDPGPMGAADPYFYQAFLHGVQVITGSSRLGIGLVTIALSCANPLAWYLVARQVLATRHAALRVTGVMALLPTFVVSYTFFMTETVLLPLMGFALWATFRAQRQRSGKWFVLAAALWCMAALTRSVALPFGVVGLAWALAKVWKRVGPVAVSLAIWAGALTLSARHSYPHFGQYSPFGNFNQLVPIYFLSGAKTYRVNFGKDYVYYFSSPSLYTNVMWPLPFTSVRTGTYEFTLDKQQHGADLARVRKELLVSNWRMLPMLVMENVIFLAVGNSWPEADATIGYPVLGIICFNERAIWPWIIAAALWFCIRILRREGLQFFPVMTLLWVAMLFSAHLAPTEGRYRKPIEPVLLIAVALGVERWRKTQGTTGMQPLPPGVAADEEEAAPSTVGPPP